MGEGTVNAGTWVPHSSKVPLLEGSSGLWPLLSAKGIHLPRTWARLLRTGPHAKSQGGATGATGTRAGDFPGVSLEA